MAELSLLVIDDETDIAEFVAEMGNQLGFASRTTTTRDDFIKQYLEITPSAVVLDVCMPETDANEIVAWMSQQLHIAPVILISGFSSQYMLATKELARYQCVAVIDMLEKPVSAVAMTRALTKIKDAHVS